MIQTMTNFCEIMFPVLICLRLMQAVGTAKLKARYKAAKRRYERMYGYDERL